MLIKLYQYGVGCTVFERTVDLEGGRAWLRATGPDPVPEFEADAFIAKQIRFDTDLWVVEVESRDGTHLLDDPIL